MNQCKIAKQCGGCSYMGMSYTQQLMTKQEYCKELLKKNKLNHVDVKLCNGVCDPYAYRNKIIVGFNQKYEYGLYEENSHTIIPYAKCLLHEEVSDAIIKKLAMMFKKYRVSIYDEKKNRGLIRHVMIRRGVQSDQTMIVLVCTEPVFKGSKNLCAELIKAFPSVKTVVLNVNKRKTSIVLGNEDKVLYGKGFIVDELCGLKFKISPSSFYQINHGQCVELYKKAIDLLDLKGHEKLLDAYCGIGTIGMIAASKAKYVIGVEVNKDAIKDAINNAKMNQIENINFICGDATRFMKDLARKKEKVDIVIMDPPRAGSTEVFMDSVKVLRPRKVVYISCDPITQVRDLLYFKKMGYQFDTLYPFDMFPFTKHVESVVLLRRID